MVHAWNKGKTKDTSISVQKISQTMRARKLDNFKIWRDQMKKEGKIKSIYPSFQKNGDLAELIGVVLGDGNIGVFPRTECLRIVGNSHNLGFIKRYALLVEAVFQKKPTVSKRKSENATDITLYEKYISKRLGVPSGARRHKKITIPTWVKSSRPYTIRYLRGLYEAEGSIHLHAKTYTHKLLFANKNDSMLDSVFLLVARLGFHPHRSLYKIQVSKREEVQKLKNLLKFRAY